MKVRNLHPWKVDPATARRIQESLRDKLVLKPGKSFHPRLIAAADAAYAEARTRVVAAVSVAALPGLELVEQVVASCPISFPYLPGLLTFREGPALLKAIFKLKSDVDLFLFDGQGIAHPCGLGLASHLGVILDVPTIGCAKSKLVGNYQTPADVRGAYTPLIYRDTVVGAALRSRPKVKPIFVSPGHRIDLESAIKITTSCLTRYRIPEPLRRAHMLAGLEKAGGVGKTL
ncbi:MAG: deoxyribonuclease V [Thermodesulfobacteriota bacterium]